jgi:hypothetical protein
MKQIRLKESVTSPTVEIFTGAHAKIYTQEHKKPFTPETDVEESLLLGSGYFEIAPAADAKQTDDKKSDAKADGTTPEKKTASDETKK